MIQSLCILASLWGCYWFLSQHSCNCRVISPCGFKAFLLATDAGHLFLYLLATCVSSLLTCLFMSFAHVLVALCFSLLLCLTVLYVFQRLVLCVVCKCFLMDYNLSFHIYHMIFYRIKVLNFDKFQFIIFSFWCCLRTF